jgi:predicted metal-dependent peptidase
MLRDDGLTFPEGALYELEPSHKGKSTEWVYNRLPTPQPSSSTGAPDDAEGSGNEQEPDSWLSGETGEGAGPSEDPDKSSKGEQQQTDESGSGKPESQQQPDNSNWNEAGDDGRPEDMSQQPQQPFGGEVRDAPTDADEEGDVASEEDWKQATQQAAAIASGQGSMPAGSERLVETVKQASVDWRSVLRRFLQEVARTDYSWVQPNRRYIAQGMYLPSLYSKEIGPMVVAIDTSGSIDNTLLSIFGAEFESAVKEMQPRRVHAMYCDARIQGIDTFEQGEPVELNPRGGGGTSFVPVFDELDKLEDKPVCVVYLTDLFGDFPKDDHGVPTLWVTPSRYAQKAVPFGEIVPVEE